jgi:hypothetical protein
VLRTSPSGHPYCGEAAEPLTEAALEASWARVRDAPGTCRFAQNADAAAIAARAAVPMTAAMVGPSAPHACCRRGCGYDSRSPLSCRKLSERFGSCECSIATSHALL